MEAYFRVSTNELLYARQNPEEPYRCNLKVSGFIRDVQSELLLDSTSLRVRDVSDDKASKVIVGKLKFAAADTLKGMLELHFNDEIKGSSQKVYKVFDKRNPDAASNFLLTDLQTGSPIFNYTLRAPGSIQIKTRFTELTSCIARIYQDAPSLPPPPFSYTPSEDYKLADANQSITIAIANGTGHLEAVSGLYFITRNENSSTGISFEIRDEAFPEVNTVVELVRTLRYISSRAEYEAMTSATNPKVFLDKFWLDCAGNKDKARELISIYYRRVREANYYFSSHIEGWKTDRGLVHIVFGNPNKVYRQLDQETWIYGEENNLTSVTFNFKRTSSPFAENHYLLGRDPIYKTSWSRAVDSWRNGRIYND
jgi:GWxTD domain-containing protein